MPSKWEKISMKESGSRITKKGKESLKWLMALFTKEISITTFLMDKVR